MPAKDLGHGPFSLPVLRAKIAMVDKKSVSNLPN
ncbi:hypothetical protein Psefu_4220 [Pseudomonas fulva 12-X]|uniref:Uncharacterized protein n=1 Tax=Pseudomonas fulva (strain 12-X) TaxID=743720 RepID=F6A8L7_PSEF1|nr:hypothetical protein Psefu_4220 [Pseudomonas fulva 12-X]